MTRTPAERERRQALADASTGIGREPAPPATQRIKPDGVSSTPERPGVAVAGPPPAERVDEVGVR